MQFDTFMLKNDYSMSQHDHYVYSRKLLDGSFVCLLYVDDIFIAVKNMSENNKLKA